MEDKLACDVFEAGSAPVQGLFQIKQQLVRKEGLPIHYLRGMALVIPMGLVGEFVERIQT